jgi:hypothetical protein
VLTTQYAYQIPKISIKLIARGNKIFQKKLRMGRGAMRITPTQFHDTYNIIPVAVAKMVEALDLKNLDGTTLQTKGMIFVFF